MELITLSIGYIVNTLAKNAEVQASVDDFVSASAKWIRSWFSGSDDEEVLDELQENPDNVEAKEALKDNLQSMTQDDDFKEKLSKWVREYEKPNPSLKNVLDNVELEIEGNINIGDKDGGGQHFDQKNIVKKSKIKGGGDFNLGDLSS